MEKQVELEMDGRTAKEVRMYILYLCFVYSSSNVRKNHACFLYENGHRKSALIAKTTKIRIEVHGENVVSKHHSLTDLACFGFR